MNTAELWKASDEAFVMARTARLGGDHDLADRMASMSDDFADQACDEERRLGIQRDAGELQ